jgi:hypothetical protein
LRVEAVVSDSLPSERAAFEADDRVRAINALTELATAARRGNLRWRRG